MKDIQKIPHEGDRIETGVVQFGDDWPGLFIRGDKAMFMAEALNNLKTALIENTPVTMVEAHYLKQVIKLLQSCYDEDE